MPKHHVQANTHVRAEAKTHVQANTRPHTHTRRDGLQVEWRACVPQVRLVATPNWQLDATLPDGAAQLNTVTRVPAL